MYVVVRTCMRRYHIRFDSIPPRLDVLYVMFLRFCVCGVKRSLGYSEFPRERALIRMWNSPMILKGLGEAVSHIVAFNETGIETPSGRVYIVVCYSKLGERWER